MNLPRGEVDDWWIGELVDWLIGWFMVDNPPMSRYSQNGAPHTIEQCSEETPLPMTTVEKRLSSQHPCHRHWSPCPLKWLRHREREECLDNRRRVMTSVAFQQTGV